MEQKVRTRYAPSPTGYMHIGNLRTALYEYLIAKRNKGDFVLRIEDTDQERYVDGAVDVIYNTLKMAGLQHDEGPDIGGEYGPYVQSERKGIYLEYAKKLVQQGDAYYCFCTKERLNELKEEQHSHGEEGFKYDRHCLHLSQQEIDENLKNGVPYVIRQKMPTEGVTGFDDFVYGHIDIENKELDDQILIKSDGLPTYNFANVIDDHLMKITHIVRGNEYLTSIKCQLDFFYYDDYVNYISVVSFGSSPLDETTGEITITDRSTVMNEIHLQDGGKRSLR